MPLLETVGSGASRGFGLFGKKAYSQAVPTSISGLYSWYDGSSLNAGATSWTDLSGNNRTVSLSSGTKSKVTQGASNGALKSFSALDFNTTTNITWPTSTISNTAGYTFIHVARYKTTATNAGRFFHGNAGSFNWLSGFWGSQSGVQYHEGWLAQSGIHDNNWVISTDQHNLYRSNGVTRGTTGNGTYSFSNITTNTSYEPSDGYIAEVMFFSRNLTDLEYKLIEGYLANKYEIDIG